MAAETAPAPAPTNGSFPTQHQAHPYPSEPYNPSHAANSSTSSSHFGSQRGTTSTPPAAQNNEPKGDISKEEVGWFFVEKYYTTLSRSPEKLRLFYSQKSQFVSGVEAEKVPVAVGQKAIGERIKDLDFQDCKVRVLNVDSQASFQNILVSVIGEISNKSEPPRKFVQTFVLAEQPNGYYVLNDIFRYLNDEDEEIVTEDATAEEISMVEGDGVVAAEQQSAMPEPNVEHPVDDEITLDQLGEKQEEVAVEEDVKPKAEENIQKTEVVEVTEEQAEIPASPDIPSPVIPATTDVLQPEKPKEPVPTPIVTPPKAATPTPEKEPTPAAKPPSMTWASVASKTAGATALTATAVAIPVTPMPQPKLAPSPPQPAISTAGEAENAASQSSGTGTEWQTAGGDHSRRQSRQQSLSGPVDEQNTLGYIKNVNEKVDASILRQTLSRFGKLKYFDVSRQRSCAFVEFADATGYKAAVAANPHQIGSEQISVEERRPRPNAYGGSPNYGAGRGGPGRGRGGDGRSGSQGRGGFQKESGRYPTRGRGGSITPKGRSQAQAA